MTNYTFPVQTGGVFYWCPLTSRGIDTRQKGLTAFSVSSERNLQSGVNGIA